MDAASGRPFLLPVGPGVGGRPRGRTPFRYKDGTPKPDRPMPDGYTPRTRPAVFSLNPRSYQHKNIFSYEGDPGINYATTSDSLFKPPTEMATYVVQRRFDQSPRMHAMNSVGKALFGAEFGHRWGMGSPPSPPVTPLVRPRDQLRPPPASQLTVDQKVAYRETALRHEQKLRAIASARLHTQLRSELSSRDSW